MGDIQSPTAEIRRGKKKKERMKNKQQDENIYGLPYYIGRPQKSNFTDYYSNNNSILNTVCIVIVL